MSCNSCSNITLPGVAGPAGVAGDDGGQGIQGIQGIQGLDGIQGPQGPNGTTLLQTLTSASSDITSGSYTSALASVWGISSNTLNTNGDTLRLQAQSMITPGSGFFTAYSGMQVMVGNSNPPTQAVEIGYSSVYDFPNFQRQGNYSFILEVDMVRVSTTTIRMESKLMIVPLDLNSNYAQGRVVDVSGNTIPVTNSSQVITVSDLGSNSLYMDIKLNTSSGSQPVKLLYGKLYLLNK